MKIPATVAIADNVSVGDLILYAIPAFLLLLAVEFFALRHVHNNPEEDPQPPPGPVGFERSDTQTSLIMGVGNVILKAGWGLAEIALLALLYEISPLRMPASEPYTYAILFVLDDFLFYCYHRSHHEIRLFWAQHVVHHSSRHFNLSTALRQQWVPMTELPFLLPMALLGFTPVMIIGMRAINLMYQYWIHTETIGRFPRPIEYVFNTPSHHRVHHGANEQYLDRNYAGVLIIWDRIFGTFEPEGERVVYGLTKNIHSFNPLHVFSHEWRSIWRDVRGTNIWREKAGYLFRGPGWTPAGSADRRELEREGEGSRAVESKESLSPNRSDE